MQPEFWHKQTLKKPLFPDLEWSRPENRAFAGKLLVMGGNSQGFAAPAEAYGESLRAGIGVAHALLPDAIQRIVGVIIENADFAPSTPSGSFSQKALLESLTHAAWADGVLLAGDIGRNSETAILLEKFLSKHPGKATLTRDAVDYATSLPQMVINRPETLLVLSLGQLQRLGTAAKFPQPIAFSMDLLRLVDWLHEFTRDFAPHLIVRHLDTLFVAVDGEVSTTPAPAEKPIWRLKTAAHATVWWIQNPQKPFAALSMGALQSLKG